MLYMIIGTFEPQDREAVLAVRAKNMSVSISGLKDHAHWVAIGNLRNFTLVETDDPAALSQYVLPWLNVMKFEIVPLISREEIAKIL